MKLSNQMTLEHGKGELKKRSLLSSLIKPKQVIHTLFCFLGIIQLEGVSRVVF